jgi:hypothetical protein
VEEELLAVFKLMSAGVMPAAAAAAAAASTSGTETTSSSQSSDLTQIEQRPGLAGLQQA